MEHGAFSQSRDCQQRIDAERSWDNGAIDDVEAVVDRGIIA
jgi:hypothetical protein